jgi:uncharacterized membrane protein
MQILRRVLIDARKRVLVSLVIAIPIFCLLRPQLRLSTDLIATWDVFAFCVLVMAWATIWTTPRSELGARAKQQDVGRVAISALVVVAACTALLAVVFLIHTSHNESRGQITAHLILALSTVALSWLVLHTVYALHYAHSFYGDSDGVAGAPYDGGLEFPNEKTPDYSDFAYFSFVIGMTCQVSDVQCTSQKMRRLALFHGVLSFAFNTLILAFLINTTSGLI